MNITYQAGKETVLVVDDTPENLGALGEILRPHYHVRLANTGQRALEICAAEPRPDLVLLDVNMPAMDGYEVLSRLHADPDARGIPVIFVTGLNSVDDEERGLELGAVDYITKPIRPRIVLARVRTHLDLKRANDLLVDHNLYLEQEISRRVDELADIQNLSIHTLAHLADTRDAETGKHLRRTQEYMRILATELARRPEYAGLLSPYAIDLLAKSAPLHDIGKVGVPDNILRKPGALTPEEYEIMKGHCLMGWEAIEAAERDADRPAEYLRIAKEIARHHHEKWDGTGYPDRLAGIDIPLAARLMAIADAFDAMVSWRPYRHPMSFSEARDRIHQGRGSHFDPAIVDAFDAVSDRMEAIAKRFGAGEIPQSDTTTAAQAAPL
ncbi:MAG TPA: two-component system response regulator [Rhodocyclaceae bacterium]|nr:two-component system response regulator [Rhodocyclaceae bacterium]